jgi:hypothetical protein
MTGENRVDFGIFVLGATVVEISCHNSLPDSSGLAILNVRLEVFRCFDVS